jgi:UDPglucose 6-dehydrogenase
MEVTVIGLGKLGLPLATLFASVGHRVNAYDSSKALIESLESGTYKSSEPGLMDLLQNSKTNLNFCHELDKSTETTSAIFIIVPTPSQENGYFSNDSVLKVLSKLNPSHFANRKVVIDIVSTVMPGSCEGVIRQTLETRIGKPLGEELGLCYNPEFIALGSVVKNMQEPDMHLLGESSSWAGDVVEEVLASVVTKSVPCQRMNLTEAELVKIAVNNFVTMKISYANALYQAGVALGDVDIDVVTNAIGLDTRIGKKYLKGAAPYGGPCFPRDTRALTALFDELGVPADLSRATEMLNKSHVSFISDFVKKSLGEVKTVGLVGVSYKPGTPVIEESPGVSIAFDLVAQGYRLQVWDDENAQLPAGLHEQATYAKDLSALVEDSDFIVITRPTNNLGLLLTKLEQSQKPYLDLWRQQK